MNNVPPTHGRLGFIGEAAIDACNVFREGKTIGYGRANVREQLPRGDHFMERMLGHAPSMSVACV